MKNGNRQRGLTRTEVVVAGGCLVLLTLVILPALSSGRDAGKRAVCLANLKTLGAAMRLYAQDHEDKIPAWGWEFDECGRYGPVTGTNWTEPDDNQLNLCFEGGYIWEYVQVRSAFVCPSLCKKFNPRLNPVNTGCPVWGWPDPDDPSRPWFIWGYTHNFQPGVSLNDPQWRVNPELVLPSPQSVFMLYEEDYNLVSSYDNGGALFPCEDYLGSYHMVSGKKLAYGQILTLGSGNLVFFDGHVDDMRYEEFAMRVSTNSGMLELCGGYMGFTWPGF